MMDTQELYIHLEGLTPFENMLYHHYVQKAQEVECPKEAATYLGEVERLKDKVTPAKDLTAYLTA
jgi:hypothetical protein